MRSYGHDGIEIEKIQFAAVIAHSSSGEKFTRQAAYVATPADGRLRPAIECIAGPVDVVVDVVVSAVAVVDVVVFDVFT